MMLDRQVHINVTPNLLTPNAENYIGRVTVSSIVVLVVTFIVTFLLLTGAERIAATRSHAIVRQTPVKPTRRWFWIFASIMAICWLPWLLSYYPGGVFPDTYWVYDMIAGRIPLTNHQPVFYTGLNAVVFYVTQSVLHLPTEISVLTMTMLQYLFMAFSLAYFLQWLLKRGVSRVVVVIVLSYFSLFPLFFYYASSNWKDTWFSIVVFLFSVFLVDVVRARATNLCTRGGIAQFLWLAFAISWFRNNGVYIVAVTVIILLIVYRRVLLTPFFSFRKAGGAETSPKQPLARRLPAFLIAAAALIITTGVVQDSVFNRLGFNPDQALETYGIPIQQVCSVIANGGNVTPAEHAVFDRIVKPEIIDVYFSPNGVDTVKQYLDDQAKAYLSDNQGAFLKTWLGVVLRNPGLATKAYLLTTLGFWDPVRGTQDGYMMQGLAPGAKWYDLVQRDVIFDHTGISVGGVLAPRYYFSAALFCWIALFCLSVLIMRRKFLLLVPFVPMLALWGTVMFTTPLAFSLRYVFAFVPFVPLATALALDTERWMTAVSADAVDSGQVDEGLMGQITQGTEE